METENTLKQARDPHGGGRRGVEGRLLADRIELEHPWEEDIVLFVDVSKHVQLEGGQTIVEGAEASTRIGRDSITTTQPSKLMQ